MYYFLPLGEDVNIPVESHFIGLLVWNLSVLSKNISECTHACGTKLSFPRAQGNGNTRNQDLDFLQIFHQLKWGVLTRKNTCWGILTAEKIFIVYDTRISCLPFTFDTCDSARNVNIHFCKKHASHINSLFLQKARVPY